MNRLPWDDLKVAFDCNGEKVWDIDKTKLPEGWELVETDCSGARCVAIFRVEGTLSVSDALQVKSLIKKTEMRRRSK